MLITWELHQNHLKFHGRDTVEMSFCVQLVNAHGLFMSTTIPNWSKGNNRTKDSATSLTNWKSDQMKLVQSSELRASSDLISDEFQLNLSSKYKAAVTAHAMMVESKRSIPLRSPSLG